LELAQRGIDASNATAELRYRRGSDVFTSDKNVNKIRAEDLSKLIEESGESRRLVNLRLFSEQEASARSVSRRLFNLKFSSKQEGPARSVSIRIELDGWVYYTVQSSDSTWALGRFHELTEVFLANRRLPAKAEFPLPEILSSSRYATWGAGLLTPTRDWRIRLVRAFKESPVWVPLFVVIGVLYSPPKLSVAGVAFLLGIVCAYVAIVSSYTRWLMETYRSYISITPRPRGFISLIIGDQADPGYRAMFLVTAVGVLVAVLAFIFGRA